jgi:hypothetical protein
MLESVAQLLRAGAVSHERLIRALCDAAPQAVRAVHARHAPASAPALAKSIARALPAALHVDVRECLLHRWLPLLSPDGPPPEIVRWTLRPRLEWVIEGRLVAIALTIDVDLSQHCMRIERRDGQIQIGSNGIAWHAKLSLAVADACGSAPAIFHASRADVYLPEGPWLISAPTTAQ